MPVVTDEQRARIERNRAAALLKLSQRTISPPSTSAVADSAERAGKRTLPPSFRETKRPCPDIEPSGLPMLRFSGTILYCRREADASSTVKELLSVKSHEVGQADAQAQELGFDIEWCVS